jgi:hypothetical protein
LAVCTSPLNDESGIDDGVRKMPEKTPLSLGEPVRVDLLALRDIDMVDQAIRAKVITGHQARKGTFQSFL